MGELGTATASSSSLDPLAVVVGVGPLGVGVIAVAEQQTGVPSVRTYCSDTRSEKTGAVHARSGPGRPGGSGPAGPGPAGRCPAPAARAADHGPAASTTWAAPMRLPSARTDTRRLGRPVLDAATTGACWRSVRAAAAGGAGEGQGGLVPVAVAAAGLVGEPAKSSSRAAGPQTPRRVVARPARPRCRAPCCMATLARSAAEVPWADADQVAGLGVARRGTEDLGWACARTGRACQAMAAKEGMP